jgi:hypothetical protein|tara:strand:+ start:1556 stop:2494 length:939 start_codon:yes stop_codon:yes gene_type:complete
MPRNVYFSQAVRSEQNLYEDLIVESLKIYGQDVYYIPRTLVNRDSILNEDPSSKFDDAYLMEAYIENVDGFEGSGDLYSKFGLEIRDEATFIISRKSWNYAVGLHENKAKPSEGDLLFLPMTNSFFEISYVEDDSPFFQLSNLPVYKLTCSLFEYSDEDFETGVGEIDDKTGAQAYQLGMDVTVTGGNHFEHSEIVTQELVPASGGTAAIKIFGEVQTITKTSDVAATISVSNIGVSGSETYRQFIASASKPLIGGTSTNSCVITKVYDIGDNSENVMPQDGAAQNVAFETLGDNFIDFTESNPFGDPSETY